MLKGILNERAKDQGNGKRFNTEGTEGGTEGTEKKEITLRRRVRRDGG
jgi:hypothetical protein